MKDISLLDECTFLITGATGLIGKNIIKFLLNTKHVITIYAVVRDLSKAERIFSEFQTPNLKFIVGDICDLSPQKMDIDYIIHGASQTASDMFIKEPVQTITTALEGTKNMLEIGRLSQVKGFIFLSSMEVYGTPSTDEKIDEKYNTNLDTMMVRSCYPESKRMCENMCSAYAYQYGVPATVIRLTQTFGPGVEYDDKRVFAEFARCVIEKKDIVLKTKGKTKRSYLFTDDAVDAILTVLVHGNSGEAYNAANEDTYCSIYDMACLLADNNGIAVVVDETSCNSNLGYAPTLHMNLDTKKLRQLGWSPKVGLYDMYQKMISDLERISLSEPKGN